MLEKENSFDFVELIRKSDYVQVYTSLAYKKNKKNDDLDLDKIRETLNYYFERVNGGIKDQMESTRLSDEQKRSLKFLDKSDYLVRLRKYVPLGYFRPIFWTKEAVDFLK